MKKRYPLLLVVFLAAIYAGRSQSGAYGEEQNWLASKDAVLWSMDSGNEAAPNVEIGADMERRRLSVRLPERILAEGTPLHLQVLDWSGRIWLDAPLTQAEQEFALERLPIGTYRLRLRSANLLSEQTLSVRRSHKL